ncbi:hypothetical protein HPC49_31825 [Pyxidicoccus fallax]|uniref:Uncharacterized protein n=1 Tax=Pyxidicoccus fallax TaxID=394095 RepID=A0A848LV86_9BACT|nr:hypothetical protein [Pyxidicoccus fallax]NMO21559.1 hypothetical protein [Pyxidicoccus fallax]NPC82800.1 hypothetical protein [Pyxidicoccus fallax]
MKRPEDFVTRGRFDASGVFIVDQGGSVVAVERNKHAGIIYRREFSSLQPCFEFLLPLFRRFLKSEFDSFAINLLWDDDLFPRDWRYTTELTLNILQKSLQSPDAFHSAPTRTFPPIEDVIALLAPHKSQLIDEHLSDGPHLVRTQKGYAFRWYERGQTYEDKEYNRFEDALRQYLELYIRPDSLLPRPRFCRLDWFEFHWKEEQDPPV